MSSYLTLVFDVGSLTTQEIKALTSQDIVRYMAWGHIPYQRDELLKALELYLSQDEIAQGYGAGIGGDAEVNARAAIVKATGDQHAN